MGIKSQGNWSMGIEFDKDGNIIEAEKVCICPKKDQAELPEHLRWVRLACPIHGNE